MLGDKRVKVKKQKRMTGDGPQSFLVLNIFEITGFFFPDRCLLGVVLFVWLFSC